MDDTWTATSGTPPLVGLVTLLVWTGTEMIIWGGGTNNFVLVQHRRKIQSKHRQLDAD